MFDNVNSLKRRVEELEEVQSLARSLSTTIDIRETLKTIADCCLKLCNADYASIILLSPVGTDFSQTMVRTSRESEHGIDHVINIMAAGWIAHNRRPILTDDILKSLDIRNPSEQLTQLGSAVAVPLCAGEKTIGMINLVNARGPKRFTDDDLRVIGVIAPLASSFLERARLDASLKEDNLRLKKALRDVQRATLLLGESVMMKNVRETISRVASSTSTVLLLGETGTGKELAARMIHAQSDRAAEPFIAVNCAAIPATLFESELFGHERGAFTNATELKKGCFELAHQGTLFLDEISAMPPELQPKLLRALENRSFRRIGSAVEINVDIRLIAATNKDLEKAVGEGEFRKDLFYRLNVVPIRMPALRERPEDIPVLVRAFLDEFSRGTMSIADDAVERLQHMTWQGNVRELRNVLERACILLRGLQIRISDLRMLGVTGTESGQPDLSVTLREMLRSNDGHDLLEELERRLVQLALHESQGNASQASRILGVDRKTIERRIEKFGL